MNNFSNFRLKFLFDRRSVLPKESMGQTMQSNHFDEKIPVKIYLAKLIMLKKRIIRIYAQNISCQVMISMKMIMKICNDIDENNH